MRLTVSVVLALSLAVAGQAAAETGSGRYAPHGRGAIEPDAPALSTFGDDVIRVRAYPSFTGTWMVELHGKPDGSAEGQAVFFDHVSRATGRWPRIGTVRIRVWREAWAALSAQVDDLLAEGQTPAPQPAPRADGMMEICVTADGTSHQIERRRAGRDSWMTSQSGDDRCGGRDPSEAIAQLVFAAASAPLCMAMQGAAPCERDRGPPSDALADYRQGAGR